MKKLFLNIFFSLFLSINCFAQIQFQDHIIYELSVTDQPRSVHAADIDNDGDIDVLSASEADDKIAWYENTDGLGTFGTQRIITINANVARSVSTADIDSDGDLDVLSASGSTISWYENTDGLGAFGTQQPITNIAYNTQSVHAADLDNDGDIDLLSTGSKLTWYENLDGFGTFGTQQIINETSTSSVYAVDIDNDGDMDVLSSYWFGTELAWYENIDGQGSFEAAQIITSNVNSLRSVYASDIDNDGDMDVFSASGSTISWYENTDGLGVFGTQQTITINAVGAISIHTADLDNDGDMDVLSASFNDDKIAWYENIDGLGTFSVEQIITINADVATSVYTTDLDGDGDMDVLSASHGDDKISWYENTDSLGTFGEQQNISSNSNSYSGGSVSAADIDSDGNMDILSHNNPNLFWFENVDGQGSFNLEDEQLLITLSENYDALYREDIDGDGDLDVITANFLNWHNIAWYENTDGLGTLGNQQIISVGFPDGGSTSVSFADLDGDGDMDILACPKHDTGGWEGEKFHIEWYENTDGLGTFVNHFIFTTYSRYLLDSVDLDGDGDLDVISASSGDNKIAWHENTDGSGAFGQQQIISSSTDTYSSITAADIDDDGDMDLLIGSYTNKTIAWYENTDGLGTFGLKQEIFTTNTNGSTSISAIDLDIDGDIDILSNTGWYENTNGLGAFSPHFIFNENNPSTVFPADFDNDNDIDFVYYNSNGFRFGWYENLATQLSVETFGLQDFIFYPNPVINNITIKSKTGFDLVVIYDINGRILKEIPTKFSSLEFELDVKNLNNGLYFIELKSGSIKHVQKFIKK